MDNAAARQRIEAARDAFEKGEVGTAKALYREVIKKYADTAEADLARDELAKLARNELPHQQSNSASARQTSSQTFEREPGPPREIQKVLVVDLDIKFGSLVWLMIKIAIAAIPATLILYFIGIVLFAVLGLPGLI